MKTNFNSISTLIFLAINLVITGCSTNDDLITIGGETPTAPITSELIGLLEEDMVLNPGTSYNLTGTFEITSGNKLTIPAGTKITAKKGTNVYIVVHQNAMIDIQGNASNPVIMRSENETAGDWGGLVIAGNASTTAGTDVIAEVGGIVYGGSANDDSSGSIQYLVISDAGAQINSESQYNGLSLYAVGSGTSISNIAILNGADDGVEFFGGSVSVSNLYLENNEDDAVDWTEGWNGSITNTYVLHTILGFSTAIEADGVNNNPTITNFTAVSTKGGTALQFKKQSGATINGLSLSGYDRSIDMKDQGALENIKIENIDAELNKTYNTEVTVSLDLFDWINNKEILDSNILQGVISENVSLDPFTTYNLTSSLIINDGVKFTIPAGTKIIARDGGTDVYIAVLKGGLIDIQGTETNPVVISSANGNPGDWGGLTICGNAPTTAGVNAVAEVGGFIYGGSSMDDTSGSIKNLVVVGSGAQINADSQYNGISLYAVGSGTTIENIAVINGADDGIEFFGGTVSVTNMYLQDNEDDAVDWTEGWNGTVTNTFVKHDIPNFSTAVEADGLNENPKLINFTAVSSTGGTALQFKKESGASFTNIYIEGYTTNIDMKDNGPLKNIQIEGEDATFERDFKTGSKLDISKWNWSTKRL